MDHTDDFPSVSIELALPDVTVVMLTESQGPDHVPWALTIKKETFVIAGRTPTRAYRPLEPYLQKQLLEQLANESLRRR
jgi:hypothetical protein